MTIHFRRWCQPCSEALLLLLGGDFAHEAASQSVEAGGLTTRTWRFTCCTSPPVLPMTLDNQTRMPLNAAAPGRRRRGERTVGKGKLASLQQPIKELLSCSQLGGELSLTSCSQIVPTACSQCQRRMHSQRSQSRAAAICSRLKA